MIRGEWEKGKLVKLVKKKKNIKDFDKTLTLMSIKSPTYGRLDILDELDCLEGQNIDLLNGSKG